MAHAVPPPNNVRREAVTSPTPPALQLDQLAALLAATSPRRLQIEGFRRAGVLVPVLDAPGGLALLFTVRAARLNSHAGEVAFPGGRLEPGESHQQAALRETEEEVGLKVAPQQVLGTLSDHPSPAGYVATPVVARVPWPQELTINPGEVASVFTVPLAALAAIEPDTRVATLPHYRRLLYSYPWQGHSIWGFTGNVVRELLEVAYGQGRPDTDPFQPV